MISIDQPSTGPMRIYGRGESLPPFVPPDGTLFTDLDKGLLYRYDLRTASWIQLSGEVLNVRIFGAKCDDVTDDSAALQAAVDQVGDVNDAQRTGVIPTIFIPGPCLIKNTITVRRKSVIIQGAGWGRRNTFANRAYLRWAGAASVPMLKIQDCLNSHVRNLRLIGNITNVPSAAINFNETNDGWPLSANSIEDVFIGLLDNNEGDAGQQFQDGILLDGFAQNNAELTMTNVRVNNVSRDGIHVGAIQSVDISLDSVYLLKCARAGIYNSGYIVGQNVATSGNACDIMHPFQDDQGVITGARTQIDGFFSEAAGRLAQIDAGFLLLNGSSFALTASLNADGKVIKNDSNATTTAVELRNIRFLTSGSPPTAPYLAMSPQSTGTRTVVIDNCTDWNGLTGGTNGMDVATTGASARAYVFWRGMPSGSPPVQVAENYLSGTGLQWDITHYELGNGTTDMKWNKALVAMGGGAAPTLGTIGGSGPAAAGQNSWLRVLDSTGAACWVPVWK